MEYELDLHKAPEHQKELCMKKLEMAIAILHQAISENQEELFKMYILKIRDFKPDLQKYPEGRPEVGTYEINTDDIPFTE